MFTRTESGLYRPRTIGEDKELEMHALNAPLLTADYVSSISQVLSPKRDAELRDLARIVRDTAESHVRTKIPNDLRVRAYRDADTHPHLQTGLKVELCYAYALLHATDTSESTGKKEEFLKEAVNLENEAREDLKLGRFYVHASVILNLRMATLSFFRAAWNFMNKGDQRVTSELLDGSLQGYQNLKRLIENFSSAETKEYAEMLRQNYILQVGQVAQALYDKRNEIFGEKINVDKESIDEFLTMLVTDQFNGLLQDVLFGQMRCYALQGDYRRLTKTALELREAAKNSQPAPVITESATIISYDADKNKLPDDLISTPFISDSPPIVLEAVESIKNSFGKVSSKLWVPGAKKPSIPIIP